MIDDLDLNLESQTRSQPSFRPTAANSLSLSLRVTPRLARAACTWLSDLLTAQCSQLPLLRVFDFCCLLDAARSRERAEALLRRVNTRF